MKVTDGKLSETSVDTEESGGLLRQWLSDIPNQSFSPGTRLGDREMAHPLRLLIMTVGQLYCPFAWVVGVFQISAEVTIFPGMKDAEKKMVKSVLATLAHLWHGGVYFSFFMLAVFSIVVPVAKMIGMTKLLRELYYKPIIAVLKSNTNLVLVLTYVASYQLLDIFVIVIFVSYFNSDSCDAKLLPGFYWFMSYCCASMIVSVLLDGIVPENFRKTKRSAEDEDGQEEIVHERPIPDAQTGLLFSVLVCVLAYLCYDKPFLEVRSLLKGITVDRKVLSLKQIWEGCSGMVHWTVILLVGILNVVVPGFYMLFLNIAALFPYAENTGERFFLDAFADMLRPWVTTDVCALGAFLFLFTIQDENTLTHAHGVAFFMFLGIGFAIFFLRWFWEESESTILSRTNRFFRLPARKFWIIVGSWLLVSLLLWGGVPGAQRPVKFESLDSVCQNANALLGRAFEGLPASYGNCKGTNTTPPEPCVGTADLFREVSGQDITEVKWLAGINSLNFNLCTLEQIQSGPYPHYTLSVGGKFDYLKLYLNVSQSTPFGLTVLQGDDNCCGENIQVQFQFILACGEFNPQMGRNVLDSIFLSQVKFDKMIVHKDFGNGIDIQAQNIAPKLEDTLIREINTNFGSFKVVWGNDKLSVAQFLDQVIYYNSKKGACPSG